MEFKKRWTAEVVPEGKPPALELAALQDDVPALTKTKITDASILSGAWKILEIDYGNVQEIQAKHKDQVRSIKLKATGDSA